MPNLAPAPAFASNSALLRSASVDPSIDINPNRVAGCFRRAGGYADDLYQDAALDYLERKARGATVVAPLFSIYEAPRRMWCERGYLRSRGKVNYHGKAVSLTELGAAELPTLIGAGSNNDSQTDVERLLDMRSTTIRLRDSLKDEDHRALVDLVLEGQVDACTVSENNPLFGDMRSLSRTVRNSAHLSAIVAGAFNV